MNIRTRATISCLIVFLVFICGCTIETEVRLHDDASGEANLTVRLHPVAVRYMTDIMSAFDDSGGNFSVFDVESISASIASRPGVELISIDLIGVDTLLIELTFADVRTLLDDADRGSTRLADSPVTFTADSGRSQLDLRLSRSNFGHISGLFVLPDSPVTVLLPYSEYDFMPEEEYRETLEFALEDYLEGAGVNELLDDKAIIAYLTTDRELKKIVGGEIENGRALFRIPLIDVLTLEEERFYSLVW